MFSLETTHFFLILPLLSVYSSALTISAIVSKNESWSFNIKISSTGISVVVESDKQDYKDANQIIKRIQNEFNEEKYITVRFN